MGFFSVKNGFSGIDTGVFGADIGANIGRPHFFYHFLHFLLDFQNSLWYFTIDTGGDIEQ